MAFCDGNSGWKDTDRRTYLAKKGVGQHVNATNTLFFGPPQLSAHNKIHRKQSKTIRNGPGTASRARDSDAPGIDCPHRRPGNGGYSSLTRFGKYVPLWFEKEGFDHI